jgi:hypothetical protein
MTDAVRFPGTIDEQVSGVRHVLRTHDGKPIGHTEPLDTDNPLRGVIRRNLKFKARVAAAEDRARSIKGVIRAIRAIKSRPGKGAA